MPYTYIQHKYGLDTAKIRLRGKFYKEYSYVLGDLYAVFEVIIKSGLKQLFISFCKLSIISWQSRTVRFLKFWNKLLHNKRRNNYPMEINPCLFSMIKIANFLRVFSIYDLIFLMPLNRPLSMMHHQSWIIAFTSARFPLLNLVTTYKMLYRKKFTVNKKITERGIHFW